MEFVSLTTLLSNAHQQPHLHYKIETYFSNSANKTKMNRQERFRRSVSLDPEALGRDAFTKEVSLQKSISAEEGKAKSKEVKLDLGGQFF